MPRQELLLHPQREPAKLRAAATVLLLRDSPAGLEVLMTRRSMTASFAPGAYVFPGGGIDAADAMAHSLASRRPTQSDAQLTESIAAIRECFEELGVVLTDSAFLAPNYRSVEAQSTDSATTSLASNLYDRHRPFLDQVAERGEKLAADRVFTLARWITDRDLPRRFDVPFLVAPMPAGQTPVADEAEQFEPIWISPAEALARHVAGTFFIIFPTIRTLERLKAYTCVADVMQACAGEQPLWTSCPRAGLKRGQDSRHMAHEMEFGELEMVSPDGQIVHELAWQHEKPVPLLKHLMRLTAPNESFMTGPGTNTYIVGSADTGYVVIDPGPALAAHVQRIVEATGGDVRLIVCTHSHADHSPAAPLLQAACKTRPPILGMASAPTSRPNAHFVPSQAWDESLLNSEHRTEQIIRQTGDLIQTIGSTALESTLQSTDGSLRITLAVIHTPGHAANHVCLHLKEDGLLFSGDHVLNGSTTVIDPPDGHMSDYLESLDRLIALCEQEGIQHILPAHGYVLGSQEVPPTLILQQLKAHRLKREAKVKAAMDAKPDGSTEDWVAMAYADVPQRAWPVAQRSLLAHVARLSQREALPS